MAATTSNWEPPVAPAADERDAIGRIGALLAADGDRLALVGSDGVPITLPPAVVRTLRQAVAYLADEQAVAVIPIQKQVTTQQAADLLNVSRPYLVRLLDEGQIPATRTGTHRRVRLDDLLAYKAIRDAKRREGLRRLKEMSEAWGLYDAE